MVDELRKKREKIKKGGEIKKRREKKWAECKKGD
jgi:hypothetical protein